MDLADEVEVAVISPMSKGKDKSTGKKRRGDIDDDNINDDNDANLNDIWTELYCLRNTVDDLVQAQENMEDRIIQKLKIEFRKQKLAVEVREDARNDSFNAIADLVSQKPESISTTTAAPQPAPSTETVTLSAAPPSSAPDLSYVRAELSKIKILVKDMQLTM